MNLSDRPLFFSVCLLHGVRQLCLLCALVWFCTARNFGEMRRVWNRTLGKTSCTLGANQCHFTRRQTCRLQSQSWRAVWTVAIALAHAQKVQIGLPLCGLRDHLPR
uniref:(northern house mosquito) hypothetical protein n=1 Tax=Culex pipiens TaxID=7175 RepID=A0A8D8DH13_CULPI